MLHFGADAHGYMPNDALLGIWVFVYALVARPALYRNPPFVPSGSYGANGVNQCRPENYAVHQGQQLLLADFFDT